MAGTLSIVATPIGHLEDITLRALSVLRTVSLIAAEDTRRTRKLLAHFGIPTPTISFHEHNTRSRLPVILGKLKAGESVALVSDAGTPMLSDPGLELVQRCIEEGVPLDPVPGASAPLTLAVVAGFQFSPWTIFGFPPQGASDRKRWFATLAEVPHAVTFFEAPHRIAKTLDELSTYSGERPIIVGRELTKIHEVVYRGTASSILTSGIEARGEFTIMLGPATVTMHAPAVRPDDQAICLEFGEIAESNSSWSRREVIKTLADRHGLTAREIYAAVERSKHR